MNVSFDVIDGDERDLPREAERFGICDADKQRTDQVPGPAVTAIAAEVPERNARLFEGLPHHRDDGAQMFARGEFGNNTAIFCVGVELRGDDARANTAPIFNDGGGGFIARTLDS